MRNVNSPYRSNHRSEQTMPIKIGFNLSLTGALGANRPAALPAQKISGEDINRKMRMMGRLANVNGGRLKTSVTAPKMKGVSRCYPRIENGLP